MPSTPVALRSIAQDALEARSADHPILESILQRWSPRAMSGSPVDAATLAPLFEAARWAPSSYNRQPWRFLWSSRGDEAWDTYLGLLNDFNRSWCTNAGALLVLVSKKSDDGEEWPTHSFDSGAAWQNFALQGVANSLVVHAMAGFDASRARAELAIPETFEIEAMIAVGHPASSEVLADDLRTRETPSQRKSVDEIAVRHRLAT